MKKIDLFNEFTAKTFAVPESLAGKKESFGEKIVKTIKSGAQQTAIELVKTILTQAVIR